MDKLGYEDETKGFVSSLIITFLFPGLLYWGASHWWLNAKEVIQILAEVIFCALLLVSFSDYIKYRKSINRAKMMKINGTRVHGTIVGYKAFIQTRHRISSERHSISTKYMLCVEYTDPDSRETMLIETPPVNFIPSLSLGSDQCSVYILGKDIYVSDYIENNRKEPFDIKLLC